MAQGIAYGGLKVIDQKPVNPQIFLTDPHWLPGLCGKVVAEGTQLSGAVHPVKAPRIRVGEKPCRKDVMPDDLSGVPIAPEMLEEDVGIGSMGRSNTPHRSLRLS